MQEKRIRGNVYFSPHQPRIVINGQSAIVAWSKHAVERICQRLVPNWQSHAGLLDVFEILYECRWCDPCELYGENNFGFSVYSRNEAWSIATEVLGKEAAGSFESILYRIAYCSVALEDGFAKATSALYPGYDGTPECRLLKKSSVGRALVRDESHGVNPELMKWFHDNGVPQIFEGSFNEVYPERNEIHRNLLLIENRRSIRDWINRQGG